MSRKLKDFIDENRRAFDDDQPSSSAWQQIERSISAGETVKRFAARGIYKWSAAAAVFFIIGAGIYFIVVKKDDKSNETVKTSPPPVNSNRNADISKIAPEYAAEATKIYQSIDEQQQQLKLLASGQPELYTQFAQDLAALDSSYRVLKLQALQTPGHEVLIKAMLQNLQLQAELLAKQLLIIHEFNNNNKTDDNEKINNRNI